MYASFHAFVRNFPWFFLCFHLSSSNSNLGVLTHRPIIHNEIFSVFGFWYHFKVLTLVRNFFFRVFGFSQTFLKQGTVKNVKVQMCEIDLTQNIFFCLVSLYQALSERSQVQTSSSKNCLYLWG